MLYRCSSLDYARLGMTTPGRHLRSAVARNRVRRVIRESFRLMHASLGGFDVVVMVKAAAATATSAELRASLDTHWTRLGRAASRA